MLTVPRIWTFEFNVIIALFTKVPICETSSVWSSAIVRTELFHRYTKGQLPIRGFSISISLQFAILSRLKRKCRPYGAARFIAWPGISLISFSGDQSHLGDCCNLLPFLIKLLQGKLNPYKLLITIGGICNVWVQHFILSGRVWNLMCCRFSSEHDEWCVLHLT